MVRLPSAADRVRERILAVLHRAVSGRIPLNGSIALTHRCNLCCVHCYLGHERHAAPEGGERDTAFWLSVLDQAAAAGCLNLLITGGEPLLRQDFAEIYTRAKRLGLLVTVFTNATLVDEAILELFADLPPQLVEITLYGATERVYDQVTGVRGSHGRCLAGAAALRQRGIRVGFKTMILAENRHEIPAMRRLAVESGVDFRLDPALFPCKDGHHGPLSHRIPPEEAVAIEMEDPAYREKAVVFHQRMRGLPPESRLFGCLAGVTGFHVDPVGMLLPCLMVADPAHDLRRGSLLAGWRDVIPAFREQGVPTGYECHRCGIRHLCGACPATVALETGNPYHKAEYSCRLGGERHRMILEELRRNAAAPGPEREEGRSGDARTL
jgi:radical SAM protein with 4Fe4S-binding SPASM domain